MTKSIIKAVEKGKRRGAGHWNQADDLTSAGVRAIIAKGWSSRGGDPELEGEDIVFPESCYGLDKVPHAWLFPKSRWYVRKGLMC
jgi:sterol 3beta-glucosyltransferase